MKQNSLPIELVFTDAGKSVQFSCQAGVSFDFEEMDNLLADRGEATRMASLRTAIELYRGDLLAGLDDSWCIYHRELYRARYLSALEELIDIEGRSGNWMQTVDLCIRLLIEDPFAEHIHCKLINAYRRIGNRVAAMRQFQLYSERLRHEFEISPMPETVALFEAIVQEHAAAVPVKRRTPRAAALSWPNFGAGNAGLSQALRRIRRDIERATDTFEYSVGQSALQNKDGPSKVQKSSATSRF